MKLHTSAEGPDGGGGGGASRAQGNRGMSTDFELRERTGSVSREVSRPPSSSQHLTIGAARSV